MKHVNEIRKNFTLFLFVILTLIQVEVLSLEEISWCASIPTDSKNFSMLIVAK